MNTADRRILIDRVLALAWEERERVFGDRGTRPLREVEDELHAARQEYLAALRPVELSRNPLTGEVFRLQLDTIGLDAPWWTWEPSVRPDSDLLPECFAYTGAMRIQEPVHNAPWLTMPGPGAPFVVPRLLEHEQIQLVVSSVDVGHHRGYLLTYFAAEPVPDVKRTNHWGLPEYWIPKPEGGMTFVETYEKPQEDDFDLAPWVERGRVSWIAPGDTTLTLRQGVDGCPYLGLDGSHEFTFIQRGEVWHPSDP